jgi:hypothetical protein
VIFLGGRRWHRVSDRFFRGPMSLAYSMSTVVGVIDGITRDLVTSALHVLGQVTRREANE